MASAQLASITTPATVLTPVSYQDAIRSIALEQIDGEDTTNRVCALARSCGLDSWSIQADVDQAHDLLLD